MNAELGFTLFGIGAVACVWAMGRLIAWIERRHG